MFRLDSHLYLSNSISHRFLWAKFQLDYICKQANEIEVRNQLTKLPTGLNKTYNRIWKRIMGEFSDDDTERKWALKTLTWVLRAKRPLSSEEILQATAIELASTKFEPERMAVYSRSIGTTSAFRTNGLCRGGGTSSYRWC